MKRHFQAVRKGLLMAVLAVGGAVGGIITRGLFSHTGAAAEVASHEGGATEDHAEADQASPEHETSDEPQAHADITQKPPDDVASPATAPLTHRHAPENDTQAAANALIQGDLLLHSARFAQAVRHYRHLLTGATGETDSVDVRYRLALCAEALGNDGEALAIYQQVAEAVTGGLLEELARLGQARVLAGRGETAAVQQLLRRWVLEENETLARSIPVSHEALYFLGAISTAAALDEQSIPLWSEQGLAQPRNVFEPTQYLPAVFEAQARPRAEIPVGLQLVHQLQEPAPGSSCFQARLARTSIERVLQQVCELSGWALHISPLAQNTMGAQTAPLEFQEKSADLLFDLLLAPLGLGWTFADRQLQVLAESEMADEARVAFRGDLAKRMLFAALVNSPNHAQAPAAYVLLGNLSFREQQFPTARQHFERILQQYPRSNVEAETWFNLAKVAMAQGDLSRSRQALFGAIDAGRGRPLESVASLLSGRQALLFDEPAKAVRPLVRAVTLAANDDVKALSLLTLASAHLMADHPEAANIALMEDRQILLNEPYRDRAALLASLARFRATSSDQRRDRDGEALIAALSHAKVEPWFALHDHVLTVEAYEQLGLTEMALPALESAVRGAQSSPLTTNMRFKLAELYSQRREFDRAETVLAALSEGSLEVSLRSRMALAELHVRSRHEVRAEQLCRELLQEPLTEPQRIASLRLLGGIYAGRGDRQRAVLCYSGVAPQLSEATLSPPRARFAPHASESLETAVPSNREEHH